MKKLFEFFKTHGATLAITLVVIMLIAGIVFPVFLILSKDMWHFFLTGEGWIR